MARGEQWAETGVGAAVLVAAGVFLVYALSHSEGLKTYAGYDLVAKFGQAGSLAPGADVKVAGVKVGTVSRIDLDPKTYLAVTHMMVKTGVRLPEDSTVKITSDSLLGGQHVAVTPGGSETMLRSGGEFENVQGAVDLFGLIGQVLRPQGGSQGAAQSGQAGASTASPSPINGSTAPAQPPTPDMPAAAQPGGR